MKTTVSKEKFCVRLVNNYADKRFSNFAIKYLRKNEKFCETIFAWSMGPRSNILSQKNVKISWHCPFKVLYLQQKHGLRKLSHRPVNNSLQISL